MEHAETFRRLRAAVEDAVVTVLQPSDARTEGFMEACRHAVMAGGKRVRPILTHLCFAACNGTAKADAMAAALAIELLHGYTLVHDDLPAMDNDTERRGQPTVWARYGQGMAILVGDWLQAKAFALLAGTAHAPALTAVLGQAAQAVIHGQVADIGATESGRSAWDGDLLDYIFANKTAALIEAACRLGVIAADGTPEALRAAGRYGRCVGLAFQYVDDLLDAGQAADGSDEFSALALLTPDAVRGRISALTDEALAALRDLPGETEALAAFAETLKTRML